MGSRMAQNSKTQNSITRGLSKQNSTVTNDSTLVECFFLHLVPGLAFIHNITTQIDKNRYMGLRRVLSRMQNNSVLTENQTREEGK